MTAHAPGISGDWTLFVRRSDRKRVAEIDDFVSATLVPRFNQVGTWELHLPAGSTAAELLLERGAGIVAQRDDETVFSGPARVRRRQRTTELNRLVVHGVDDMVHLTDRLVHPQPASTAPPYNTSAYDQRTGTCSTILREYVNVNAGPGAISVRQVPGLTLAADPVVGTSVTGEGRWQQLLTLLQELALAGGDLGFKVVQAGGSDLEFQVYEPQDRTGTVMFSLGLGNLADYEYDDAVPEANYIYCAGGGEGTDRTIREGADSTSIAAWGRRIETFRDRRDTTDAADLDQTITEELAQKAARAGLKFNPLDRPQIAYLDHYDLGDRVTAVIDGERVEEVIREVEIVLSDEKAVAVTARVGTPSPGMVQGLFDRLFDELRAARRRIRDLERR